MQASIAIRHLHARISHAVTAARCNCGRKVPRGQAERTEPQHVPSEFGQDCGDIRVAFTAHNANDERTRIS